MVRKIILVALISIIMKNLFSCDMFALISKSGYNFANQDSIAGEFNDIFDYYDFIKERSDSLYQDDGYGIVTYINNSGISEPIQTWFKTGYDTWYGDGGVEPLDTAIESISDPGNETNIVLVHARNGTGGTGSHPFVFEFDDKFFTFMHNGAIGNSLKNRLMQYLGETWFDDHPSNWSGIYPDYSNFIDSELIFHYIMKHIIEQNDMQNGISVALNNRNVLGYDFYDMIFNARNVINFIISDGEDTFAFRNTYVIGSIHNLSYELINGEFFAIKTLDSSEHTIQQYEMVKFNGTDAPESLFVEEPLPVMLSSFIVNMQENYLNILWQTMSETDLSGWNLYKAIDPPDITIEYAYKINPELIAAEGNSNVPNEYLYIDESENDFGSTVHYWLESIEISGDSAFYGPIRFVIPEEEPLVDEGIGITILNNIYPNPFSNFAYINLQIKTGESGLLQLFNVKGQLVYQKQYLSASHQIIIDTSKFANGIYFCKLSTSSHKEIRKMIKIK
ncbi:MAG: T9SS type A sorting domain-containing protein [Candidatus Cloacimonetes bacterium]|nr:T9SS type A sorting domain-containing protein [Candidatus Cloacimonadota bacterium]